MARPTSQNWREPLSGGGSHLGGAVRGGGEGGARRGSSPPRLRIGQGWKSSAHVGRWLALGRECPGGGRERGGAARAFSRPCSSGLVEAQRAPPPQAELGLQPRGAWGGRGSLWLLCLWLGLFAGRRPGMLPPDRSAGIGLWRRDGECAGGPEGPASQQAVSLSGGGA